MRAQTHGVNLRVVIVCSTLAACTASGGGIDARTMPPDDAPASHDTWSFDAWTMPEACGSGAPPPADVQPPSPDCGPDITASRGFDPCLHHVACYGGWTYGAWVATYINGTCEAGHCVFTEPPVFECCEYGCFGDAPQGRCARLPPGAPTAP